MDPVTFVAAALSIRAVVDAYHSGSLFEGRRSSDESRSEAFKAGFKRHFFAAARACEFCFGYHVAVPVAFVLGLAAVSRPPWDKLVLAPVYALGAQHLAWIGNGLLPERLRYGRPGTTKPADAKERQWHTEIVASPANDTGPGGTGPTDAQDADPAGSGTSPGAIGGSPG